jgi:cytochrome P450
MVYDILESPNEFFDSLKRYTNSLTTTIVFGHRTPQFNDPVMLEIMHGLEGLFSVLESSQAVLLDAYPVLRMLPDSIITARGKAKKVYERVSANYFGYYNRIKDAMKAGTATPCMCLEMARIQEKEGFSDLLAAYLAGNLTEAGTETTSFTLYGFMQAMILFPEVQKKAQEELDRVVGCDRLPTLDDEPDLQYIRGCVKESLRWMPTAVSGAIPHSVMQDDEYMGYKIPKGAIVVNNVYSVNMDSKRYPNPRQFEPARYKDDFLNAAESASASNVSDRDHFTFGAGRRLCQGIHVADRSLFLGISRILWAFDIAPAVGADEKPIIPDSLNYSKGFVVHPESFSAQIKPRSKERAEIVRREWEKAQQQFLDPNNKQWKI